MYPVLPKLIKIFNLSNLSVIFWIDSIGITATIIVATCWENTEVVVYIFNADNLLTFTQQYYT